MLKKIVKKKIILGQSGGLATLSKYGPEHFSKMALKQHRKRKQLERLAQKGSQKVSRRSK